MYFIGILLEYRKQGGWILFIKLRSRNAFVLPPWLLMADPLPAEYTEPTMGMAAMRVRIVRSELKAGCMLSVFNAMIDGGAAAINYGEESQPVATSTGALMSVEISGVRTILPREI